MRRGTNGAWGSDYDHVPSNVGANVHHYRRTQGFTQERLAALVGIEVKTLQDIEHGRGNPTARVLAALAAELRIDVNSLFDPRDMPERKRGRPRNL